MRSGGRSGARPTNSFRMSLASDENSADGRAGGREGRTDGRATASELFPPIDLKEGGRAAARRALVKTWRAVKDLVRALSLSLLQFVVAVF